MEPLEAFPKPDAFILLKRFFGFLLILMGLAIAFWILGVAYHLLHGGAEIELISKVFLGNEYDRVFLMPSGRYEIPPRVFLVFGYFVVIMLLGVLAGISKTLLRLGTQLIQPDFKEFLGKLKKELFKHTQNNLPQS